MSDKSICICCNNKTGSAEHIFPAAFGGRRTNKGIYCGVHNKEFGRHVANLLDCLDIFNAILGVRPDRHDAVRPAAAKTSNGSTFMVAKGILKLPVPPRINKDFPLGEKVQFSFSSRQEADRWASQQLKNGYKVKFRDSTEVQTKFFTEDLHVQKNLGGAPFLRTMLYFGLTYFAHYFRKHAKDAGLEDVKAEILRSDEEALQMDVQWERPEALNQFLPNPFEHGHTVVIAVESNGTVKALISLWGAIQLGMVLGTVESRTPTRVTTFIDPLADSAENDVSFQFEDGATIQLGMPEDGRDYIVEVQTGKTPHPMQKLLQAASDAELRDCATALLAEIETAKKFPAEKQQDAMFAAVAVVSQRMVNFIRNGIEEFIGRFPGLPKAAAERMRLMCQADEAAPRGITVQAEEALKAVLTELANEMSIRFDRGRLEVDDVAMLIGGGEGMALAFKVVARNLILLAAGVDPGKLV